MRRRAGLALLLVVGVLGILAVLATAFVTMAQLERRAAAQRLNATKATLLARSGLEDALARLGLGQDAEDPANAYAGEDWNDNGLLDGLEVSAQVYRVTGGGTPADRDACPARHALRPSFYVQDPLSTRTRGIRCSGGRRAGFGAPRDRRPGAPMRSGSSPGGST